MTAPRVVVLVGHGAPARDCPPELVARLKGLEGRRRASGAQPSDEERALDEQVRRWPRTDATDPYRAGLLGLAARLRPLLGDDELVVAYNEFCAPTLEEVVRERAARGVRSFLVVPSMLTPGGVHSEVEIPERIAELSRELPRTVIAYAWPFDVGAVAAMLADQVRRFTVTSAPNGSGG